MAKNLLSTLTIARPCKADWDAMKRTEDDVVRFCGDCKQHVYDVSAMSEHDAEALLTRREPTCARLLERTDGTLITRECPPSMLAGFPPAFANAFASMGRVVPKKVQNVKDPSKDFGCTYIIGKWPNMCRRKAVTTVGAATLCAEHAAKFVAETDAELDE